MNQNTFEANTPDRIPLNGFRTPVNPKPPVWSPILEATTPDLNGSYSACEGTPALIQSLGINPELDISWSSAMATPTGLCLPGIKELATTNSFDDKAKNLQRRHLFHNENQVIEEGSSFDNRAAGILEGDKTEDYKAATDLISFLKELPSKFIYPEPIFINLNGKAIGLNSTKNVKQQQVGETVLKKESVMVQQKQRNSKETCKSLKFSNVIESRSCDSFDTSPSETFLPQQDFLLEPSLANFEGQCFDEALFMKSNVSGENSIKTVETHSSKIDNEKIYMSSGKQQFIDNMTPQPALDMIGFKTASGNQIQITEKSMDKAKSMFEEIKEPDLRTTNSTKTVETHSSKIDIEKIYMSSGKQQFINSMVPQPALDMIGFKTASGNQIQITEKSMDKAKSMFEEIREPDLVITKAIAQDTVMTTTLGTSFLENFSGCHTISKEFEFTAREETIRGSDEVATRPRAMFDEDSDHLPSSVLPKPVGFSTASGKNVVLSEKGMLKAKFLLSEFEEDDILPKEVPLVAGFSMASGKKVIVSDKAMIQAHTLLEDINNKCQSDDKEVSAAMTEKCMPVSKMKLFPVNSAKALSGSFPVPKYANGLPTNGEKVSEFNTPTGKRVLISEIAIAKAGKLFSEIEGMDCTPIEVPNMTGFNMASGKNVKISESALSRSRKLFDEISLNEDFPEDVKNRGTTFPVKDIQPRPKSGFPLAVSDEKMDTKINVDEDDDQYISSPTIGKKKRKNRSQSPQRNVTLTPISGTPSAFENALTSVSAKVLATRRKARREQKFLIQSKQMKGREPSAKAGYIFQLKKDETREKITWTELVGNSSKLPEMCAPYQLLQDHQMLPSVCLVQASNASSFNFFAWEHFPIEECRKNSQGFQLGEFLVILSDDNTIGCEEIGTSLLASKNVDPSLCSPEWIRNHFRWIVWKLASMEIRCPALFARTCLTPRNVLEQLKYRYDREIDNCHRSALKRIIEQDDTSVKTMILCVAEIRTKKILELTDGWYSIDAHCDQAMEQLIEKNKIFVGVKLAISGSELVSPGGSAPLEKGPDTYLKISTNSTRRARWDTKLGFYCKPMPFPIALNSVLPEGGAVSHIRVNVIRVYPMLYMEKMMDGKTKFHGERRYRRISECAAMQYERMMEKLIEDIEREEDEQEKKRIRSEGCQRNREDYQTDQEKRCKILEEAQKRMQTNMKSIEGVPMLKLRVVDWRATASQSNSAIVSIWRPSEELQHLLKEGLSYHLYNVNAAGLRFGELQLNTTKHTRWIEIKNPTLEPQVKCLERSVTTFSMANQNGFKPVFNEMDIVGLVVFVGQLQNKGPFQTVVLSDGTNYFGVKCWASLEEHALADIIVVGTFLAFSNLQWRATACRTTSKLQFAFIHEGTLVSSRPAQKHLDMALQNLKQSVNDPAGCVAEAEVQMTGLLGSATPQSVTPKFGVESKRGGGMLTPNTFCSIDVKKNDTPTSTNVAVNRARLLEKYGAPPALLPWSGSASPHVRQKFKPPTRKPPAV